MQFDPNKVSAVVFDWGGVFCNPAEPFASLALQTALGMDADGITAQIPSLYEDHYRGVYSTEEFWHKVMSHFKLAETEEINPEALSRAYLHSYHIYPEMFELVKKLQAHYTVGLISNLSPVMRDHIKEAHQTAEYFSPEVYSCDAGIEAIKPDETIFKKFLDRAHKTAGECLFVDDSQKNLDAAERLGFQTLLFTTQDACMAQMQPLL